MKFSLILAAINIPFIVIRWSELSWLSLNVFTLGFLLGCALVESKEYL